MRDNGKGQVLRVTLMSQVHNIEGGMIHRAESCELRQSLMNCREYKERITKDSIKYEEDQASEFRRRSHSPPV